ncbi:MAG: shikimate dehydrogenase [Verrucomicrobia bacterium]|jgi:shikimate dehydrogenase|nr:MAG: shikimate dehydrogenase [Verrucomicrobiota bacterium]
MTPPKSVYTLEDLESLGQPPLDPPAKLAVIGHPVAHSRSPGMHNAALRAAKIPVQYIRVDLTEEQLPEALQTFSRLGFLGVNVTIPHKGAVLPLLDQVDPLAARIGAVNTIVFDPDQGTKLGFNSDAPGFRQAIREVFAVDLRDLRVLLLGAGGGAGRAAAIQCGADRCDRLVLVNRSFEKAQALVNELRPEFGGTRFASPLARLEAIPWETDPLNKALDHVDLIVNCTNLGMKLTDPPLLTPAQIQPHHLVYDMVYAPPRTRLIEAAETAGARAANGLSMLIWQGAISFEYWFNRAPDIAAMKNGLTEGA